MIERLQDLVNGNPALVRRGRWTDADMLLEVGGADLYEPLDLEARINNLAGVVTNGIFAFQAADLVLVATPNGVERF